MRNKSLSLCMLAALCCWSAGYGASAAAQEAAPAMQGEAQKSALTRDIPLEWWTLLHSQQLDTLIKRAFKANPDVETAQAALRQARAYTAAQQGFFYPAAVTGNPPSANKPATNAGKNNAPISQGAAYYNLHIAQLTVGYVPEVFGANREQAEATQSQIEKKQMRMDATYTTLASNVVAAAIQEAALRAQIAAQLQIVSLNRQALEIARNQLSLGYVSEKDVTQQEMSAAQAQQALVPLQQQLEQTRDLLHALAGSAPDEDIEEILTLEDLHLPQALPASLPSKLAEQRPDVRIAEAQLRYVSAQHGVTVEHTMPQFELTGAPGGLVASSAWVSRSGGDFFDQDKDAAQAIFNGGILRAKQRAVRQALIRAGSQYRRVVMAALQDMADVLYVIQSDERALKTAAEAAQAAGKTGEQTLKQYEAGSVDFQALLVAQQNEQLAMIKLAQAQANQLGDAAALFQALGGSWMKQH